MHPTEMAPGAPSQVTSLQPVGNTVDNSFWPLPSAPGGSAAVQRCCGGGMTGGGLQSMGGGMQSMGMQMLQMEQQMLMMMMQMLLGLMVGKSFGGGQNPGGGGGGHHHGGGHHVGAVGGSGHGGGGTGPAPSSSTHDQGAIKSYIAQAAHAYGADPKVLTEIARRESNFQANAVNNWDSNAAKGTPSKGMFQFIEPTFNSYAAQARKANPEAWKGLGPLNWMDWRQQALATAWAIKHGHGSAWATYAAAGGH